MSRESILAALASRIGAQRAPWTELTAGSTYTLLVDGAETVQSRSYDMAVVAMAVGVHRVVSFSGTDSQRATAANNALDALISAVLGSDRTLSGACLDIKYMEGDTDYPTDGSQLVGATAMFTIEYEKSV